MRLRGFAKVTDLVVAVSAMAALSACSTVQPLGSVARRASDPQMFSNDVTVDTTNRESVREMKRLAWAAYSVDFECPKTNCSFTMEERKVLAEEIAETSFIAFDREIRRALETGGREILATDLTTHSNAFKKEIRTNSFKTSVSRWLDRLGLRRNQEVVVPAQSLKSLNPSELGWNGGGDLAQMGRDLGVDGMMVGYIHVAPEENKAGVRKLTIQGPKFWLFSTKSAARVAVAGLRTNWRLEPTEERGAVVEATSAPAKLDATKELRTTTLNWTGIDQVANGFSVRIAHALGTN